MDGAEFDLYINKALQNHPDKRAAIDKLREQVTNSNYNSSVIAATKKYLDILIKSENPKANQATVEVLSKISSMTKSYVKFMIIFSICAAVLLIGVQIYLKFFRK